MRQSRQEHPVPDGSKQKRDGSRSLAVRLKQARKHKPSSQIWLRRQLNDPYVARAKKDGYRSRAAYKLLEIDDDVRLLRPGQKIIDLGAAPGGWLQVAQQRLKGQGALVGIDILPIEPLAGVTLLEMDFLDPNAPERLQEALGGKADLVLSDMAANTTGHRKTDHLKIMALAETAIAFAREVLVPGGAFLAKVFQGGTENTLLADLKRDFASVRHIKPKASRADSAELYVLAVGFRGQD
jgi:23S rRNA (uridine2552-2'-O)-methyltransferase